MLEQAAGEFNLDAAQAVPATPATPDAASATAPDVVAAQPGTAAETVEQQIARYQEENTALRRQLLERDPFSLGDIEGLGVEPATPAAAAPAEPAKITVSPDGVPEYVDEQTFDDMFDNRAKMNEVLHTIIGKAVEKSLLGVTPIVQQTNARIAEGNRIITEFFKKNPDLEAHREDVELVANGIMFKRPGLPPVEILRLAGEHVRKITRLNRPGPAFAPVGASRSATAPKAPTDFEKQSQAMFGA